MFGLWACGLQTCMHCAALVVGSTRSLTMTSFGFTSGLGGAGADVPTTTEVGATLLGDRESGCAQ